MERDCEIIQEQTGNTLFMTNGKIGTTDSFLYPFPGIVIGRKGAYRGVHFSDTPFYVIDTAFYLRPRINDLDVKFAYYQLLTVDINYMDSGSAIPSTSREDFMDLDVLLPPPRTKIHRLNPQPAWMTRQTCYTARIKP